MKRCAFSFDFKIFKDGDFLISNGNLFHSLEAAQAHAQSPSISEEMYTFTMQFVIVIPVTPSHKEPCKTIFTKWSAILHLLKLYHMHPVTPT